MYNLNNFFQCYNSVKTGDCCMYVKSKQYTDEKSPSPG